MEFLEFSNICENLESTGGRLDTIDIIAEVLPGLNDDELSVFIRFLMGKIFPDWSSEKIGIGPNLIFESVAYVVGRNKKEVIKSISSAGDVGRAVEKLLLKKEQTSFFSESLDLLEVYRDFEYLAGVGGNRSQREKLKVIKRLFANGTPSEGKYISRLMLGELRIGVGEGNIREAIAKAFSVPPSSVEHAHQAANDLGEIAVLARKGEEELLKVKIELFRPVKMMLAKQGTIAGMISDYGAIAAEYKYDGTRFQFHKKGDSCRIYSRKLEEVTDALPDISSMLLSSTEHDVILDGEVIAVKDERPMPFQYVLRRFRRKHDIADHMETIKLVPNLFDILYLDGEMLIDLPFEKRREILEQNVSSFIAPQIVSKDINEIESFYKNALDDGHEGIMVKSRAAHYTPGIRGKDWTKIKPAVDTIDLAVIGAEWGEGKRAHLFGSFLLACQDERGELLPVSKVATGLSDDMLASVFEILKDLVITESGKEVTFEPELVFEVGYAEIQKSVNYRAGYALRFPRFIRFRDDKGVDEIETISSIIDRFTAQSNNK
ncbi:ATP-dependent DNA ligase [Methanoplanus sp. FWC-SCC4]|uniref:DNA ligase n=1 Tax=Methanochimaera problematica TaxID=2609417 RepID=A0AA97F9J9_9EURY|nr:ATP-dependent DNA ligase [Methanoplanus sp. FWC-SCC4]WOF15355.1 ATP-dependent DNA ligase [Methanoplanus sp. FWC-SCC4]